MANKHLSGVPHVVDEGCWWYEGPKGIIVLVRRDDKTTEHKIKWDVLRRALARKDKKE